MSEKKIWALLVLTIIIIFSGPTSNLASGKSITVGSTEGTVGSEVVVPVTLNSSGEVSALQFKITYDESALNLKSIQKGQGLGSSIQVFSNIDTRKVIVGGIVDTIDSGEKEIVKIIFEIKNSSASSSYNVSLTEVVMTNSNAHSIDGQYAKNAGKITVSSPTNTGGGGGAPVTPPVITNPQNEVKQTLQADGSIKEETTLSENNVKQLINSGTKRAQVLFSDSNDKVSRMEISLPMQTVQVIKESQIEVEILTDSVLINIPQSSFANFNQDLYFRLVPLKTEEEKKQVEERDKKEAVVQQVVNNREVKVLARPVKIETNMQSQPVILTLPIDSLLASTYLNNLVVFIEHSDGTKEVVRATAVPFNNNLDQIGLQFSVSKFSTFTVIYLEGAEQYFSQNSIPYINGFKDQTFRPKNNVTRAQMATMLARNLNETYKGNNVSSFNDTNSNFWAFKDIEIVKEQGIMGGYKNNNFGPEDSITRAQMATIVYRWVSQACIEDKTSYTFCNQLSTSNVTKYKDVLDNNWASKEIQVVRSTGIMGGYDDNIFKPDGNLTRAEAVKVLNGLFKRNHTPSVSTPTFKDVPKTHWAFLEIEKAVSSK